jgi:hypothetical protein
MKCIKNLNTPWKFLLFEFLFSVSLSVDMPPGAQPGVTHQILVSLES